MVLRLARIPTHAMRLHEWAPAPEFWANWNGKVAPPPTVWSQIASALLPQEFFHDAS